MNKTASIHFRTTDDRAIRVKREAEKRGWKVTHFMETAIDEYIDRRKKKKGKEKKKKKNNNNNNNSSTSTASSDEGQARPN